MEYNIFGSEDSEDLDLMFAVDEPLSNEDSKALILASNKAWLTKKEVDVDNSESEVFNKEIDPNICTVTDGIIDWCYKGTADECNNMILDTYELHKQTYPCFIERRAERDVPLKVFRCVRSVLSLISRTKYRVEAKRVLKSKDFKERFDCLCGIRLECIEDLGNKKFDLSFFRRKTAFQMAQAFALMEGQELFTKRELAEVSSRSLIYDGEGFDALNFLHHCFADAVIRSDFDYSGIVE